MELKIKACNIALEELSRKNHSTFSVSLEYHFDEMCIKVIDKNCNINYEIIPIKVLELFYKNELYDFVKRIHINCTDKYY